MNGNNTIDSILTNVCATMAQKGYTDYTPTENTLWGIYSMVKIVNRGTVPYDPVPVDPTDTYDFDSYKFGVKAEKAKHRKSRKAKRLEGTRHQGEYSSNTWGWKKCNQKDLAFLAKQEKTKFKQNRLLILEDAYSDYMETYFGDTEEDYYGFDWFDPDWEEPDENYIIVGDDWKKYAHFDENTLAEIAREKETDKYCTFDEAFAENLRQYNMGFEDGKKYIINLLEKKGIKINLGLLEN